MAAPVDPRERLRPNLDLLTAYELYEKDYPLLLPQTAATLAINYPLYKRIEDQLAEQTLSAAEHHADDAATRRIAATGGVTMAALGQMTTALRPPPPAAPPVQTLATAAQQTDAADISRLRAQQAQLVQYQQQVERDTASAASVVQSLRQSFLRPVH